MNICSGPARNRHEEIVFECRDCPVCQVRDEIDEIKSELDDAREQLIDNAKD